jgi:ABC-type glycerol-3-phosphate transport system substrate-binding protein
MTTMIRTLSLCTAAALALTAVGGPSFAAGASGHATFCKAGSPTPKYVCDALKANEKKKPAAVNAQTTARVLSTR